MSCGFDMRLFLIVLLSSALLVTACKTPDIWDEEQNKYWCDYSEPHDSYSCEHQERDDAE